MDSGIKPAFRAKVTGQAITVQLSVGDLVDPLKALEMGQAGDVLSLMLAAIPTPPSAAVSWVDWRKTVASAGIIVDGAGRDTDELEDINWPIWTRAITPRGTHTMFSARKEELSINVPIQCGGIIVNPRDFIVADLMGVTVIPLDREQEMVTLAQEQIEREEETRKWVANGKTIEDLLNEFGRQVFGSLRYR
jgi:4-hydroxy-4-methyl-2-oxoglutarate aldolase